MSCVCSVSPKEETEDQGGGGATSGVEDEATPSSADITDPEDYNKIFHPNKTLC